MMLNLDDAKMHTLTREQWEEKHTEMRLRLQNDHGVPARRATLRATAIMQQRYGKQPPGPPSKLKVLVTAAVALARKDDDMSWDWTKGAWKALRGAAAAAFATVIVPALLLFAIAIGTKFDEHGEVAAAGVPSWLAPVVAIIIAAAVSWLRNRINIKHPNNPMKKLGAQVRPKLNPNTK